MNVVFVNPNIKHLEVTVGGNVIETLEQVILYPIKATTTVFRAENQVVADMNLGVVERLVILEHVFFFLKNMVFMKKNQEILDFF